MLLDVLRRTSSWGYKICTNHYNSRGTNKNAMKAKRRGAIILSSFLKNCTKQITVD